MIRHLTILAFLVCAGSAAKAQEAGTTKTAADREKETAAAEEKASEGDDSTVRRGSVENPRTLAERIPSVTRRSFVKKSRLEVAPTVSLILNDPFYNHIMAGIGVNFHVLESLSVGFVGDYFASIKSQVPVVGGGSGQTPNFNRPSYAARLEVAWAPLYGKLSLLAERVLHFDTYLLGGGGVVGTTEGGTSGAGVLGIGQHFFVNDWFAFKIELRDHFFQASRNPALFADKPWQNFLSVALGLCFYVPPSFEHETL